MKDDTKTWLATYLYYAEPWEEFLTDAVKPFVESVLENNLAEQFFFYTILGTRAAYPATV